MAAQPNSHHRHSIGPHPDLPTITEDLLESESEDDSSITDDDNIIIDDNQSDSGSKVSYANSYAFTLDGVGFDEENSIISGICNGSVVNNNNEQQHLTPPQNNRGGGSHDGRRLESRHRHDDDDVEKKVLEHREACRKLGIPWSSAHSDSDLGSDNNDGGVNAAAAAAVKKKVKWPWPDMGGKVSPTPPTLDTLDEHMRNYALSNTSGAKKRRKNNNSRWNVKNGSALIATIVLIAICLIGIMVTALTSNGDKDSIKAEVVVMKGHPRPKVSAATHNVHGTVSAETSIHKTKAAKEDAVTAKRLDDDDNEEKDCTIDVCNLKLSHTCLLNYKVNTPTTATDVNTITFELVCEGEAWIGIGFSNDGQMIGSEAVLGMPGGVPQKYVLGGKDNSSVMPMAAHKQTLMGASIQYWTRRGLTVMTFTKIMKEEGEVEIRSGENTFLYAQGMDVDLGYHATGESFTLTLPDIVETEEQQAANATIEEPIVEDTPPEEIGSDEATTTDDGLDSSCIDQQGKFKNRNNKNRSCDWMSKSGDTLHSSIQDRECGIQSLGTQPSELGLKCRYTCRAYNGCLLKDAQDVVASEVDMVQPPPIDEAIDVDVAAEVAAPCTIDVCNLELSHTCLLKYKVNNPTLVTPVNTITFELVCEGEAWIGIGFSNDGQMVGSEAVLGMPGGVPQKYLLGGKDNSSVMPMAAHKQTLTDASVEYESGLTILKFTKIMKEEGEVEIKSGENTFLYAQGMDVDLGYHATGESFTLSLPGVEEEASAADASIEIPLAGDTFIDATKGLLRSCSWLDIRHWSELYNIESLSCLSNDINTRLTLLISFILSISRSKTNT
eukprot:scaffold33508_cov96-Skeletonema_dohrnii-CCMP3373.AAC.2